MFSLCPSTGGSFPGPFGGGGGGGEGVQQSRFFSRSFVGCSPRFFPRSLVLFGCTLSQGGIPVPARGYPREDRVPPAGTGVPLPRPTTEHESEHLLRSGQYTSCSHGGGLSCYVSSSLDEWLACSPVMRAFGVIIPEVSLCLIGLARLCSGGRRTRVRI